MKHAKRVVLFSAVVATVALAGGHAWWKGSLTVTNDSNYDIHQLFVTPAHKVKWGKDWLKKDVLQSHEEIIITGLDCDEYDFKLVDEEGDVCIVEDVDLCQEDLHWEITDRELANCSGWAK